jgi:hypothetical protein
MIDGEPLPTGRKIVDSYHGTKVQPQHRGIEACQNLWNEEIKTVGSFDDLIFNQLENAKKQGRKKVTVLDIGSGKGNLFADYLSKPQLGKKSREFLTNNTDFNIDMVGITDAKTPEELLTEQKITSETENIIDNSQIKARNIRYTLSYNQRIEDVLEKFKIEGVDLCTSTLALTYLGPSTFSNTIEDVIKNLNSGGQMIAYDYSGIAPGIIESDPGFLNLDIRGLEHYGKQPSLKATLLDRGSRFFLKKGLNVGEEEKNLQKAEDLMVKLGANTKEGIEKRRKDFLSDPDYKSDREMALGRRGHTLYIDEINLIKNHTLKLREIKKQILSDFFSEYKNQIEGEYKLGTIFFKKK